MRLCGTDPFGVGATVLKQYAYGYDLAGNRTSEQIDTGMSQATFNNLNQLTSRTTGSGSMEFAGSLDKQGTVAVGGNSATVNHTTTNFVGYASVTNGTNVVPIVATDYNNNARTNKYQLVVTNNGVAKTITFDLNGNETNVVTATSTNTYQWDAANRLMSVTGPTNQSLFTYDGLGRRVQIIEQTNGVAYATNKFVWCGQELCEQRNLTGTNVTKRFFGGGEQMSGTNYFFTRDHLGSVREMTDGTGAIKVRYDYDPYGRQTKISGTMDADFGYAGMYYHAASGLNLTLYRAYDSDLGRWPNHDPIGERGGINLYRYVGNNPVNRVDPMGLVGVEEEAALLDEVAALVENPAARAEFEQNTEAAVQAAEADVESIWSKTVDFFSKAKQTLLNQGIGRSGENATCPLKNTERIDSLTKTADFRVPDLLDHALKVIGDTKNVNYLSWSPQLQDSLLYAQKYGYQIQLTVDVRTTLSSTVINNIPNIIVKQLP